MVFLFLQAAKVVVLLFVLFYIVYTSCSATQAEYHCESEHL